MKELLIFKTILCFTFTVIIQTPKNNPFYNSGLNQKKEAVAMIQKIFGSDNVKITPKI